MARSSNKDPRSPCSANSKERNTASRLAPTATSKNVTTFAWPRNSRKVETSLRLVKGKPSWASLCGRSLFNATTLCSCRSQARYMTPYVPSPTLSLLSYLCCTEAHAPTPNAGSERGPDICAALRRRAASELAYDEICRRAARSTTAAMACSDRACCTCNARRFLQDCGLALLWDVVTTTCAARRPSKRSNRAVRLKTPPLRASVL